MCRAFARPVPVAQEDKEDEEMVPVATRYVPFAVVSRSGSPFLILPCFPNRVGRLWRFKTQASSQPMLLRARLDGSGKQLIGAVAKVCQLKDIQFHLRFNTSSGDLLLMTEGM